MTIHRPMWLTVACPDCEARVGRYCRTARGREAGAPHVARIAHGLRSVFANAAAPIDEADYLNGDVTPLVHPFEPADYENGPHR